MKISPLLYLAFAAAALAGCSQEPPTEDTQETAPDPRVAAIHETTVFADMHAHPSRFHRENVESISAEEIEVYRKSYMDIAVANISSDMAYDGEYTNRDGSVVGDGKYKPAPGEVYALAADRLARAMKTVELGYAVHADSPAVVLEARKRGEVAVLPALEGADALEGDIENLYRMHDNGLRLIQLVHFRNNELGHMQTWPYSPGGLTEFGREVVKEANRLGLIIDMAHSNHETMMDILELSEHPVLFSHGGVREFTDHVGIGSDLRGISAYVVGFDADAKFHAIAAELLNREYSGGDVGKVMGGNFFRVWEAANGL